MKAVGIVVEYNPLHNGHLYHLNQAKQITNADVVVAVMSGPFLQRGEPALVDKWTRTKMALTSGVDVVIELPFLFAVQKAEIFSTAAIYLLEAAKCHSVCFGSECGTIEPFERTVTFMEQHSDELNHYIKAFMKSGNSYPKAAALAFNELNTGNHGILSLDQPNDILGYHYVSAIKQQGATILPCTITRTSAGYHEKTLGSSSIASATSIRDEIFRSASSLHTIKNYVPEATWTILERYYDQTQMFHNWESYWPLLKYNLLIKSPSELRTIYEVKEGLENRLKEMALSSESFTEFMTKCKTKRYTWTRLQRIMTYILLNIQEEKIVGQTQPDYMRILGFTKNGQAYLHHLKKTCSLPVITRTASTKDPTLAVDITASAVFSSTIPASKQTAALKREYQAPLIFDETNSQFR